MNLRWRLSLKGNWVATFCGRRATIYLDRRGRWRVVIGRVTAPGEDPVEPEFFDHAWARDQLDEAKEWTTEALLLRGSGRDGDDPAGPRPPEEPAPRYVPWKAGARGVPPWAKVLGLAADKLTLTAARSAYRALAKVHHPDHGGDAAVMSAVNGAWEQAQEYLGARGGVQP